MFNDSDSEGELASFLFGNVGVTEDVDGGLDLKINKDSGDELSEEIQKKSRKRKAAWVDEDDETLCADLISRSQIKKLRKTIDETAVVGTIYQERLKQHFIRVNKTNQNWAQIDEEESDKSDSEDDMEELTKAGGFIKKTTTLSPTHINVSRMKDITLNSPHKGQIMALEFHPNGKLCLTGGLDKMLKIWQVDGYDNRLLRSIYIKDLPIRCAHFTPDGKDVIVSGRRSFFYIYSVETEKSRRIKCIKGRKEKSLENFEISPDNQYIAFSGIAGSILILSRTSTRLVRALKMNGEVRNLSFTKDGKRLASYGVDGDVYFWNMETFQCISKIKDHDGWNGMTIDMNKNFFVTGNDNGFVHLYRRGEHNPYKSLSNLTTPITSVCMNHDSQLLVYCSKFKQDALRVVHLETGTVYSNWPHATTPLNYVNQVSFSPESGFLAIGNARGIVLLYRLKHFESI